MSTCAHAGVDIHTIARIRTDTAKRLFRFVARILLPPKKVYYWTIYNPTRLQGFSPEFSDFGGEFNSGMVKNTA
jgi:hypothetical protein